jgi:hypothetical protein
LFSAKIITRVRAWGCSKYSLDSRINLFQSFVYHCSAAEKKERKEERKENKRKERIEEKKKRKKVSSSASVLCFFL